jgi:hypothetical protein
MPGMYLFDRYVPWWLIVVVLAAIFIGGELLLPASPWASWLERALVGLVVLLALWVPFIRTLRRQR